MVYYLKNLLFFDIPLLKYYINLISSIIFCRSSGDTYLSLNASLSCSFSTISKLFCCKMFEIFIILSASLLAPAIFSIAFFEMVLSASVADYLVWSKSFWMHLLLKLLLIFLPIIWPIYLAKDKNPEPFTNIRSLGYTQ